MLPHCQLTGEDVVGLLHELVEDQDDQHRAQAMQASVQRERSLGAHLGSAPFVHFLGQQ